MLKARKYMLKGVRATKDLFKHYAIEHYISVFEVTHGKNGFHPHFHILLFTKYHVHNPRGSVMRMQFFEQWKKACEKAGLDHQAMNMVWISATVKRQQAMFQNGVWNMR